MTPTPASENAANAANFEELSNHIDLVNTRLKALAPTSEKYEQSLEDMQDYYERAIQDRKMRIATLEDIVNVQSEHAHWYTRTLCILAGSCAILLFLVSTFAFPTQFNVVKELVRPYATTDRVVVNTILVFTLLYAVNKK
jgi:hypothetical protein